MRAGDGADGVAVRLRRAELGELRSAPAAGLVLHHDGDAEDLLERDGELARHHVGRPARRDVEQIADRLVRIIGTGSGGHGKHGCYEQSRSAQRLEHGRSP